MERNLTEIVFVVDRSGSMKGLEEEVLHGFNSMLEEQKDQEGDAFLTTVLFESESEMIHDRVNIKDVAPMTQEDYSVRGCTALLDAIGNTITHIRNIHKYSDSEKCPKKTLFIIITDGKENDSRIYKYIDVKKMIERQKEDGWEFIFLGANIDVVETASRIGIEADRAAEYSCDEDGVRASYLALNDAVSIFRSENCIPDNWSSAIEEDSDLGVDIYEEHLWDEDEDSSGEDSLDENSVDNLWDDYFDEDF